MARELEIFLRETVDLIPDAREKYLDKYFARPKEYRFDDIMRIQEETNLGLGILGKTREDAENIFKRNAYLEKWKLVIITDEQQLRLTGLDNAQKQSIIDKLYRGNMVIFDTVHWDFLTNANSL